MIHHFFLIHHSPAKIPTPNLPYEGACRGAPLLQTFPVDVVQSELLRRAQACRISALRCPSNPANVCLTNHFVLSQQRLRGPPERLRRRREGLAGQLMYRRPAGTSGESARRARCSRRQLWSRRNAGSNPTLSVLTFRRIQCQPATATEDGNDEAGAASTDRPSSFWLSRRPVGRCGAR